MNYPRILTHLYSQPLMIEQNAWSAFDHNARQAGLSKPMVSARICGPDEDIPEPDPRYMDLLQFRVLNPADPMNCVTLASGEIIAQPNDTAILTIKGMLVKHAEAWECELFGLTDLDDVDAAIAHVSADDNIRNVLLNFVNVPGGTIIGIPETSDKIYALAQTKNVKSYSDSQCTSAGVYLATQAGEFFVSPSAYSGSIGVLRPPIIDISRQLAANGVSVTQIKSGKFKDTGSMLRPITEEEIEMLQKQSDRIMSMFVSAVGRNRRMSRDNMQGQVFFGSQAVDVGLADEVLPDLQSALAQF